MLHPSNSNVPYVGSHSTCGTPQAKQLGYRTPEQAGAVVASLFELKLTSGGLYLGFLSRPGEPGPLITEAIPWRTAQRARQVWADSADLVRPFASKSAILD